MEKITGTVSVAKVNAAAQIVFKKRSDFPARGRGSAQYVATNENKIYRYDAAAEKYICIGTNPDGMQSQIDNIVISASSSGNVSAEVAQSRTSEDGTTFDTLKDRLDSIDNDIVETAANLKQGMDFLIQQITPEFTVGSYIAASTYNQPVSDASSKLSAPFWVDAGTTLKIKAQGYLTSMAILAKTDADGSAYTSKVVKSDDSTYKWYTVAITASGYYAVSSNKNVDVLIYAMNTVADTEVENAKTNFFGVTYETLKARLDNVDQAVGNAVSSISPVFTNGYYVAPNNSAKIANAQFMLSAPFYVEANTMLTVKAQGYLSQVSIVAKTNEGGTSYSNILRSTDSTYKEYTAKISESGWYAVSSNKSVTVKITAVKDRSSVEVENARTGINGTAYDSLKARLDAEIGDLQEGAYCDLALFSRFGVVGDSYASGELVYNSTSADKYDISWGQILARKKGTTCTNYSAGGLTTRSWLTNAKGLSKLLNAQADNIYYLALGINDYYSLGTNYLGTIADITDNYANNPDTFYGNYAKIIEQIQAHAPHAKMVLFTVADTGTTAAQFNTAIIAIAEHYGIPYIRQTDDAYFTSNAYKNTMSGGHPRAVAYSGMACAFERLLNKCIISNYEYFKDTFMY